jgi:hypothetical protein
MKGSRTLGSSAIEAESSFLIYLFLLVFLEAYIYKAKDHMKLLSIRIFLPKYIVSVLLYLSYLPMINRALFWTTCRRFNCLIVMKCRMLYKVVILNFAGETDFNSGMSCPKVLRALVV